MPQSPGVPEHLARSSLGTAALGTTGSPAPGPAGKAALGFDAQQTKAAALELKRSLEKQLLVRQAGGQHGQNKPEKKPVAEQRALCSGSSSSAELWGWISSILGGFCSGNVEHEAFGGTQRESRLPVSTPGPCNYATINPQCICRARRSTRKPRVSTDPPGNVALVNPRRRGKKKKKGEQRRRFVFF